jgi:Phage integrase family
VQLSILGKGGKVRQVLLPDIVSRSLLSLRGDAGANQPVFASRKGGHLTERAVNGMVKRAARKAGINEAVSPHWLRHALAGMPLTAAPLCPRCSRRWATATSPPRQATCTRGPTRRAAYTWIRECFFDEEEGKGKRGRS